MKKLIVLLLLASALSLTACEETMILHCDRCGTEVKAPKRDNSDEDDWMIYCGDCAEELGLNDLVSPG